MMKKNDRKSSYVMPALDWNDTMITSYRNAGKNMTGNSRRRPAERHPVREYDAAYRPVDVSRDFHGLW